MTKADFFALAGFACITTGAAMIYRPLGFIVAGVTLVLYGRALHFAKSKSNGAE